MTPGRNWVDLNLAARSGQDGRTEDCGVPGLGGPERPILRERIKSGSHKKDISIFVTPRPGTASEPSPGKSQAERS